MKARIRTIKPEALSHEDLWDLESESGLPIFRAWVGLICHADREGRFKWRPRTLKSGVLPYWEGDFAEVLTALEKSGFIQRYEVEGTLLGCIPTFSEHQRVNTREAKSDLPAPPPGHERASENASLAPDGAPTTHVHARVEGNGTGTEGNGLEVEQKESSNDTPAASSAQSNTFGKKSGSSKTTCPVDFRLSDEKRRELAGRHAVEVETIIAAELEFKAYWRIGNGAGTLKTDWESYFVEEDLARKAQMRKLSASKLNSRRGAPPQPSHPDTDVWGDGP